MAVAIALILLYYGLPYKKKRGGKLTVTRFVRKLLISGAAAARKILRFCAEKKKANRYNKKK